MSEERPGPAHDAAVFTTPALLLLAVVAFVTELALFGGVGAIAFAAVGGGAGAWFAAAAATALVVVLWGLFMAPRGRRRLGPVPRTVLALLLCTGAAIGLVLAGWTWWGWFVGVVRGGGRPRRRGGADSAARRGSVGPLRRRPVAQPAGRRRTARHASTTTSSPSRPLDPA